MRGVQNEVARTIHKFGLLQRCGTPAKKHQSVSLSVQYTNRSIGELLPSFLSVRKCGALTHGKYCVEQKHTEKPRKQDLRDPDRFHAAVNFLENISRTSTLIPRLTENAIRLLVQYRDKDLVRSPRLSLCPNPRKR